MRLAILFILTAVGTCGRAQVSYMHLSPLQTIEQKVGQSEIKIEYSRPHLRGRTIFGDLEPWDKIWRTGANRNTMITFSDPVYLGETRVPAGTYALLSKPGRKSWEIYLYRDLTHWEVPEPWDEKQVAATITVTPETTERTVQRLTFTLDEMTDSELTLALSWENTRVPIPLRLTTDEIIKNVLAGPSADDFYSAALYRLTWGGDFTEGLIWAEKAVALRPKKEYWDEHVRAKILAKLGRWDEAISAAEKGLALAEARPSTYGVNEAKELIAEFRASRGR
ncbi:MAG: DUF2911 domain-containing protein [Bacteroidota bacterium]